jgi:anti-sigma B factor antagonist
MMQLEITERQLGEAVVLAVRGRLVADQRACPLCDRVDALLESGAREFLIDLSQVTYIDSAGVGALVWKYRSVTSRGGTFTLLQPNRRVRTVLRITRLDTIFEIYDSEAEALAKASGRPMLAASTAPRRGPSPVA